jgi:hypothetical protein
MYSSSIGERGEGKEKMWEGLVILRKGEFRVIEIIFAVK